MRTIFVGNTQTFTHSVAPPPASVPSAPTGLVATPITGGVNLVWNANPSGDGVTAYNVYRASGLGASFGSSTLLTSVGLGLSYSNTGLIGGTQWTYFVTAVNVVGSSSPSTGASATVIGSVPATPTGLMANADVGEIDLSWNANLSTDNVTGYSIYRASGLAASFGSASLLISVGSGTLSYSNTGLTTGNSWTYWVIATNLVGSSPPSAAADATVEGPPITVPSAPTGVVATASASGGAILVSWNANSVGDTVTDYKVYRASGLGASFGSASFLISVGTSLSYNNIGLTTGNSWTYFVIATNAAGNSSASAGDDATVLAPAAETNFITSSPTLAGLQNDTLYIGMRFTVGSQNIRILSLGRWKNSGDSGTHQLKMVRPFPDNTNVANVFTTVDMSGGTVSTFVYGNLLTPVVLAAGSSFYLVSDEIAGGDSWRQLTGTFGTTTDATLIGGVYGVKPGSFFDNGIPGQMYGPLDFKYQTTSDPATAFLTGSLYQPQPTGAGFSIWARVNFTTSTAGVAIGNVTGITDLRIAWSGGGPPVNWSGVLQYYYDDEIPIGSPIHDVGTNVSPPLFVMAWDTTQVADGTHVVYARGVDANNWAAYNMFVLGNQVVIHNTAYVNGAQDVWVSPGQQITHRFGTRPDKVHFSGDTCPTNAYHGYFGPAVALPAYADSRYNGAPGSGTDPALLRDSGRFLIETSRANDGEWEGFFRWMSHPTIDGGGAAIPAGGVYAWAEDPHRGGIAVSESVSKWTFKALGFDGKRFDNFVNAGFATYVEAPAWMHTAGGWLGIDLGGRLFLETHEGEVITIAGPKQNRASPTPPWADIDTHMSDGVDETLHNVIEQAGTIVGTFDSGIGDPEYMLGGVDLCIDPRDDHVVYVCSEYLFCIFKITLTGWPTTPAHVSLYAGTYDEEGFANVSGTGATNAKFHTTLSIQMGADGTMYVADSRVEGIGVPSALGNQCIRYITPDGLTVGTLVGQVGVPTQIQCMNPANIPTYSPTTTTPIPFASAYISNPRVMRFNSTGTQLIVMENNTAHVRRIDLIAQTVTFVGRAWDATAPVNMADFNGWIWGDVDRHGVIGPVDDMIFSNPTIGPSAYRMSKNGPSDYGAGWSVDAGVTSGVLIGRGDILGAGHYGWSNSIADTQGRAITSGTLSPASHRFRIAQATGGDATYMANSIPQQTVLERGAYMMTFGHATEWPANIRPTFYALFTKTGNSQLGTPTFDDLHINYPTHAALATFIQSGAGGIAPRPEITGRTLRDLEYFIRRFSYNGSYPVPVNPAEDDSLLNLWYPIVTACNATVVSPTSIQVNWTTDKPTIGCAVASSDVEYAQNHFYGRYSAFSPIENLTASTYATSHSAIVSNLSPNHTIHYNVVVMDVIGNFAHYSDQTIDPGMTPDGTSITTLDLTSRVVTVHGLWTWGVNSGPTPGWGGGPFHRVLLNGQPVVPSFEFSQAQKITVMHGGNVYWLSYDQIWTQWCGGQIQPNDNGTGAADPPAATPTPPALPNAFVGPYLPSADGTTISGGTGLVITREGVWSFGPVKGSGWEMYRNGKAVIYNNSDSTGVWAIPVSHMTVNSNGRLFYRNTDDTNWYLWASTVPNMANVSSPGQVVPVEIKFLPARGQMHVSDPAGTLVTRVYVVTSNGSPFAGTLAVGTDSLGYQIAVISGLTLVKNSIDISPSLGGTFMPVTATQNGVSMTYLFNSQVGA